MNSEQQASKRPATAQLSTAAEARAITDGELVLATVEIPAKPERVFEALFSAECERWWGAAGVYATEAWQADVRVGGAWSLVTRLPDGTGLPASGEFVEVSPSRVVQTRRYDWDHPTLGRRVTRVTTLLASTENGTRVTVRHDGFTVATTAIEHAGGWERLLDWLGAHFSAKKASAT